MAFKTTSLVKNPPNSPMFESNSPPPRKKNNFWSLCQRYTTEGHPDLGRKKNMYLLENGQAWIAITNSHNVQRIFIFIQNEVYLVKSNHNGIMMLVMLFLTRM